MRRIVNEIQNEIELVNISQEDKKKMGVLPSSAPKTTDEQQQPEWEPLAVVPQADTSQPKGLSSLIQPPKAKLSSDTKRVDKAQLLDTLEKNCRKLHECPPSDSDSDSGKPNQNIVMNAKNVFLLTRLVTAMRRAADKMKREHLRDFLKENHKVDRIPGEHSIPPRVFQSELNKFKPIRNPGLELKQRIYNSNCNVA